jgi:signal transduction histidine kinase/ketosteroid isomerase-like protein
MRESDTERLRRASSLRGRARVERDLHSWDPAAVGASRGDRPRFREQGAAAVSSVQATDLIAVAQEYQRAFNERDLNAWVELLDSEIEIEVDSFTLRGVDDALGFAQQIDQTFPGMTSETVRILATSGDTVICETRPVNRHADSADPTAWYLGGMTCMVFEFREGRVARLRHYYAPSADDRTGRSNVPSRFEAAQIADEQAALRRVATLVARGATQTELFVSACAEVAQLIGADAVNLGRFRDDGMATNVGGANADGTSAPIGIHVSLEGESATAQVYRTGRAARVDDYDRAAGEIASVLRTMGLRSSVGVPVVVAGEPWGLMVASTNGGEALPPESEERMTGFAELVATAISNSDARAETARLADEQAALRRVATLITQNPTPADVFAAVTGELGQLFGVDDARVLRYEENGAVAIAASWGALAEVFPADRAIDPEGDSVTGRIRSSGRPECIDDFGRVSGPLGDLARDLGLTSAAGAPIVVDGRLWGVLAVDALWPRTLPPDSGERLAQFADLTGTAIANIAARSEAAASRARLVAAADVERHRVVRDLHDGAQQALVHTIVTLKMAQRGLTAGDAGAPALVDAALDHAERATTELRELSHGILPAVLTRSGLSAAVATLAARSAVPVSVDVQVGRLPGAVEASAYFVVAEGLTNIAKHARASRAAVSLRVEDRKLVVEVSDDGAGGAHALGSGLVGLSDRVGALSGRLSVVSPLGEGTTLTAIIPL